MELNNNWFVARYIDEEGKTRVVACDDRHRLVEHLATIGVGEYSIAEETFTDLAAFMRRPG